MQRGTVRQKDKSKTEGEGLQNSDQVSDAIWGRNMGNEETRKTDCSERDEDAMVDMETEGHAYLQYVVYV